MTDTVERLRNIIDTVHPQMQATIDRLTKDNADLSEACADGWGQARKRQDQVRNLEAELQDWKAAYHADTKRIEAERDRLREALQLVRAYRRGEGRFRFAHLSQDQRDNALMDAWQEVEETILAALKETGHE